MLALKNTLTGINMSQAELARLVELSPAAIAQWINHEVWPKRPDSFELMQRVAAVLEPRGVAVNGALFEAVPTAPTAGTENETAAEPATTLTQEVADMLLQKQTLTPGAKKAFNLFRSPFDDDVQESADLFTTPDARAVREHLWTTARHGGFIAIVGESGAGKTTLVDDLKDRIRREGAPIVVIEPSVRRMEENDKKGKSLKSGDIEEAIIYSLDHTASPRRTAEARARQVVSMLDYSARAKNSHVILIEEAHTLPTVTLKHLKRFFEIKAGFARLLGIILVGQPELRNKLSGSVQEVREVAQRCEQVELPSLDAHLEAYLRFKFQRVGADLAAIVEPDALDAIRTRLIFSKSTSKTRETISLMYPLMVNNLVTAALNQAAALGFDKLSADLIREV